MRENNQHTPYDGPKARIREIESMGPISNGCEPSHS